VAVVVVVVANTWTLVEAVTARQQETDLHRATRHNSKANSAFSFICPEYILKAGTSTLALRVFRGDKREPSACGYNWDTLFLGI
jgi:hypothetical protein